MNIGCAICQDPFDAAVGIVTTKCGHVFHNICIQRWLQQSSTCPECRRNVCKNGLTKLFFNSSCDNLSDNDVKRRLDVIKEQLMSKDLKILEKDEAIKELQSYCASAERNAYKMSQTVKELQHELSVVNMELKKLNRLDGKNQKLLQENNILQSELEHLNYVKKIVIGCSKDAKKILADTQVHVRSKEGKLATRKIAAYCSVIKRELTCLMEEKNQLKKELTKIKREMGTLQVNSSVARRVSFEASPTNVRVLNSVPAECGNLASFSSHNDCENQVTPITFDSPRSKRQEMNIDVLDGESETPVLRLTNSVSTAGYIGLGRDRRLLMSGFF